MPLPYALETLDKPWRDQRGCADQDPIYWHPRPMPGRRRAQAEYSVFPKSICRACPVRKECLLDSKGARGIWGGLDDGERFKLLGKTWMSNSGPPHERHLQILAEFWQQQETT